MELFSFLSDKDLFAEIYRCPDVPQVEGHWWLPTVWCLEFRVGMPS